MYEDAMSGISEHLVQKSLQRGLTYTSELIPQRGEAGQMFVLFMHTLYKILIPLPPEDGIWCPSKTI